MPRGTRDGRPEQYRYKTIALDTAEFIRRFLIHILPRGLHRISGPQEQRRTDAATLRLDGSDDAPPVDAGAGIHRGEIDCLSPLVRRLCKEFRQEGFPATNSSRYPDSQDKRCPALLAARLPVAETRKERRRWEAIGRAERKLDMDDERCLAEPERMSQRRYRRLLAETEAAAEAAPQFMCPERITVVSNPYVDDG